jgi:hypothetical protein
MKQTRTFWEYCKNNWNIFPSLTLAAVIGIVAFSNGVPAMGWFMTFIFLFTLIGSIINWKTKG